VSLVLDTSITLAWVYPSETTPAVATVLERAVTTGAWVPSLWRLEVANVLEMGVRRGRTNAEFRDETLADLGVLDIHVDPETNDQAWTATLALAIRHKLTLYDAAYLELALRRALPLATLDSDLRAAATAENVVLLGL
jgi:predicted nucleic acid-binding protein